MVGEAKLIRALTDAQRAFQKVMRQQESLLEKGDAFEFEPYSKEWKITWEKGKRALELAEDLKDRGYFTTSIELCFYTFERSFEAWIMKRKGVRGFRAKHCEVFDIAYENKMISQKLAEEIRALWDDYRVDQYYRPYVPSRISAEKMVVAARTVVDFIEMRL